MKTKALVVIDMQNDFVTGNLGTAEAQAIIPKIYSYIINFDGDIYFTQDTHRGNYKETLEGKTIPSHCMVDTKGWQIVPELSVFAEETIKKDTFGCDIHSKLAWQGKYYKEICFVGVCTDICVLNCALQAIGHYDKIVVLQDLCAGTTPENHQKALDIMKINCIEVV